MSVVFPAIYATYDAIDFESIVENENSTKSTIITTVNLKESASVSISGTNASCFAVNTKTIEDNSETEITITFTAPDVDVEIECTATLTITGGGQTKEIALHNVGFRYVCTMPYPSNAVRIVLT